MAKNGVDVYDVAAMGLGALAGRKFGKMRSKKMGGYHMKGLKRTGAALGAGAAAMGVGIRHASPANAQGRKR